jgi:hypothetical protein
LYRFYKQERFQATKENETFISFTTTPERLNSSNFYSNLRRLIRLAKDEILILNLPEISRKGMVYKIPEKVKKLESEKFIINIVDKDEGPITKLLPSLRNKMIKENDIIIIIDDDHHYKRKTFKILKYLSNRHPDKVISFCSDIVRGYQGFSFIKKTMLPILDLKIPNSCIKIDDLVIQKFIKNNKIPIKIAYYTSLNKVSCFDKLFNNRYCNIKMFQSLRLNLSYKGSNLSSTTNRISAGKRCSNDLNFE